jgi:2-phospho-L-lactate/phosphoenolpyruvate guanylyltransferase
VRERQRYRGSVPAARGATGPQHRVLVPIKAFSAAKGRLRAVLDEAARVELVRTMAANVLHAAAPLDVCVACDDPEVAAFAESHGATVSWTPGLGLNGAVEAGVAHLAALGADYVTVVHADLPLASGIGALAHVDGVTIAPDRRHRGTNLLRVPTTARFAMHFGRDSYRAHLAECARLGLAVEVLERDDLAFDVDVPSDLAELGTRSGGTP